ncbi:hypothetical protein A4G23_00239 [Streptomyces rubrolavendulae]|uniref:Uncharacterized protein n=1 Tax=Streptomyces rubrolavendulae TaxID=285473 RepID=A0A1D8FW64_9ACTN|nr:hypothetical protein A4G23_00239 [Streptomyces rubrolavendulae]
MTASPVVRIRRIVSSRVGGYPADRTWPEATMSSGPSPAYWEVPISR